MAEKVKIKSCEDLSWTGKLLTCVYLEQPRKSAKCKHIIVDDKAYEVHLAIPDSGNALYIDGIHSFADKTALLT